VAVDSQTSPNGANRPHLDRDALPDGNAAGGPGVPGLGVCISGQCQWQPQWRVHDQGLRQNWTHVRLPTTHVNGLSAGVPSNDPNEADTPILGGELGFAAQGNYDQSIAINPVDPKIIYVGGTLDGSPTGYIRVDITHMSDPHAFYQANDRADGGLRRIDSVDRCGSTPIRAWARPASATR